MMYRVLDKPTHRRFGSNKHEITYELKEQLDALVNHNVTDNHPWSIQYDSLVCMLLHGWTKPSCASTSSATLGLPLHRSNGPRWV